MSNTESQSPWRIFRPILAGANARDRLIACVGAVIGIAMTGLISAWIIGPDANMPLLVAPMGAASVLLFAVPASPMAQPWPIIGGNALSALVGVVAVKLIGDPMIAAGVAVGGAIGLMSVTRSLHPPGGAAAITAVLGGPGVLAAGFAFPLIPVALNAVILVFFGWATHRLTRRAYPHRAAPASATTPATRDPRPVQRVGFNSADVDAALAEIGETFDISREDIDVLLREVETHALVRAHGDLTCQEIMSRDVVSVPVDAAPETAQRLLIDRRVRLLPVIEDGRVAGAIGLRELAQAEGGTVGDLMSRALTVAPDAPAVGLWLDLTEGQNHAAIVVDGEDRLLGLLTQTDLLAAMAHELSVEYHPPEPPKA